MANIPTRENQAPPQSRVPQRPEAQYNRPTQYTQPGGSPRMQQAPRVNPQAQSARPGTYPPRSVPPRAAAEQLRPIPHKKAPAAVNKTQKSKSRKKKDYTKLKDFLLAFTISLVLFGIAAIIVCNALISLFA